MVAVLVGFAGMVASIFMASALCGRSHHPGPGLNDDQVRAGGGWRLFGGPDGHHRTPTVPLSSERKSSGIIGLCRAQNGLPDQSKPGEFDHSDSSPVPLVQPSQELRHAVHLIVMRAVGELKDFRLEFVKPRGPFRKPDLSGFDLGRLRA